MPRKGSSTKTFWNYIMASPTGTLYNGVTSELSIRVRKHKLKAYPGFSAKYGCTRLVWYECWGNDAIAAITREKEIKAWSRKKKIALIEAMNPRWEDLARTWGAEMVFPQESLKEVTERASSLKKLKLQKGS